MPYGCLILNVIDFRSLDPLAKYARSSAQDIQDTLYIMVSFEVHKAGLFYLAFNKIILDSRSLPQD